MSSAPENRDREPPADPMADSCFWPRPVDPEQARRSNPAPPEVDRSVVELTSPIGHRLRVPAQPTGEMAAPGSESVLSAATLPPKKKRR